MSNVRLKKMIYILDITNVNKLHLDYTIYRVFTDLYGLTIINPVPTPNSHFQTSDRDDIMGVLFRYIPDIQPNTYKLNIRVNINNVIIELEPQGREI